MPPVRVLKVSMAIFALYFASRLVGRKRACRAAPRRPFRSSVQRQPSAYPTRDPRETEKL